MTATDHRVRELVTRQAAEWLMRNRDGLPAQQRKDFMAWLTASPLHVEEYLALAMVAQDLRPASELSGDELEQLLDRARSESDTGVETLRPCDVSGPEVERTVWFRWQTAALATLCALTLGLLTLRSLTPGMPVADPGVHFETRHGEQQSRRLADNSVVHLNTDSAMTIRFNGAQRLVQLEAGEAVFDVAHDSSRPFRVVAGAARIVAIGTRFDVRLQQNSTVVTVMQGRIAVGPDSSAAPESIQLEADQTIRISRDEWPAAAESIDAHRATAWLHRQIKFEHETLEQVANEFNRYAATPFEITTPALRSVEISGVFATDDTDAFIAFLRSLDGVRVEVTAGRIRVLQD